MFFLVTLVLAFIPYQANFGNTFIPLPTHYVASYGNYYAEIPVNDPLRSPDFDATKCGDNCFNSRRSPYQEAWEKAQKVQGDQRDWYWEE